MSEITPFHRAKLEAAYDREDRNGDGRITDEDFKLMAGRVAKISEVDITEEAIEKWLVIFNMYYKDSPDKESFVQNTWKASLAVPREQAIEFQKPLFDLIDVDSDGVISPKEWANYLLAAVGVDEEEAAKAFAIIDTDGDGTLSVDELGKCSMLLAHNTTLSLT